MAGTFQVGDVILGKYEITRVLGKGGMGMVVAALHRELDGLVALKFLLPAYLDSPQSCERFAREARTGMRIKNEHVARVFDVGTVEGAPFIVMEYLTGQDLSQVIAQRGALPIAEAVDLLLQACEAVADAHKLGIVHRDLKPANIFVTTGSDDRPFIKVLDFGISKSTALSDLSMTASAAVVGSPLYMSPEQLASSGTVDARADVWSLGVILYEMLTGTRPFAGESFATLSAAILRGTYTPVSELRPDCPAPLEEAIVGALARDREGRLPTVAALAAGIAPCGSAAARASCERIERIAARVAPPAEPGERDAGDATVEQGPPSAVASVPEAPREVTQAPALGRSVAPLALGQSAAQPAPRARPLPRVAKLALGAGAAGLVVAAALVGLQHASWSPLAASRDDAVGGTYVPPAATASPIDSAWTSASASPPDADAASASDGGWQAIALTDEWHRLGDFAVAASPSREHPGGVIAALSFAQSAGTETAITLAAIDLASGRVFGRNLVGDFADGDDVRIARTRRGVVVAHQRKSDLQLQWYTDGTIDADTRSVVQLAAKKDGGMRGFWVFDDRIVVATGGAGPKTVSILDDKGKLLTSHACHGDLFTPGDAQLVHVNDDVIVTNFAMEAPDRVPVCAGGLHGSPRWREVTLRGGQLEVGVGEVYFSRFGGADHASIHALDENLQPTGLPPPPEKEPVSSPSCDGLTGTIMRRTEEIAGQLVVSMVACCGDEGGGLFVCRPPKHGP